MWTPNFKASLCVAAKKAKLIAMHTTAGHANWLWKMIVLLILCTHVTFIDIRKPHTLGKNDTIDENLCQVKNDHLKSAFTFSALFFFLQVSISHLFIFKTKENLWLVVKGKLKFTFWYLS